MNEEPDSLVPRYLRRFDDKFDRLDQRPSEVICGIKAVKLHQVSVAQTDLAQDEAIGNLPARLDRIERRLDLREDAS